MSEKINPVFISKSALEDALVSQTILGGDRLTLLALAVNFGVEAGYISRVAALAAQSKAPAPLLVMVAQ